MATLRGTSGPRTSGTTSATSAIELIDQAIPRWYGEALCAQTSPESFYPEQGGSSTDAKRTCLSCTVREECLEYAVRTEQRFGIWGGLSERERRKLAKAQPKAQGLKPAS